MKAKNHKEITRAYWKFSLYLATCALLGVLIYFCYARTSATEVERIIVKTEEYDRIYVQQVAIVNSIDSLYYYTTLFNTNLNDAYLLNSVSRRKQEIFSMMENLDNRDIRIYRKLMTEVNDFLSVKDSIRIIKEEEDMARIDLLKCAEENRQTSRKLTMGGVDLN